MFTLAAILSIFLASSQAISFEALVQEQWEIFKLTHRKLYPTEVEDQYRQRIFMENLHRITSHNELYATDLSSYKMGINHFADLTEDEFLRLYTVDLPQSGNLSDVNPWGFGKENFVTSLPTDVDENVLSEEVDWRRKGAVTPVKNQGACGSCWSFSATGALEGQWFKKTGILISLSEQNLIDCSWTEGNHGCNGGWMRSAFKYIKDNHGIDTSLSYPYEAKDNKCRFNPRNIGANLSEIVIVPQGEDELKAKVTSVGPIAIAMQVIGSFQFYEGGVYDDPNCGFNLNHAMLAVGYGNENGKDYWLVKNSWGTRWWEQGYVKMSRNKNNQCGIATAASHPLVK